MRTSRAINVGLCDIGRRRCEIFDYIVNITVVVCIVGLDPMRIVLMKQNLHGCLCTIFLGNWNRSDVMRTLRKSMFYATECGRPAS